MKQFRMRTRTRWLTAALIAVAIAASSYWWYTNWWYTKAPRTVRLPSVEDIDRIEVSLYGSSFGPPDNEVKNRPIDKRHFANVVMCLTPATTSESAKGAMTLEAAGELRIYTRNGQIRRIVFVDYGKNPLCFSVDGVACLRGGPGYDRYQKDHRELYGLDSYAVDEGLCLSYKLADICGLPGPFPIPESVKIRL